MKRLPVVLALALLLLALVGCQAQTQQTPTPPAPADNVTPIQSEPAPETEPAPEAAEPDLPALAAQILDCGAFSYEMEEFDKDIGCSLYGLAEDAAEEMYFYFPPGPTADELALFKAKDEAGAEALSKAVAGRIEYQRHAFESYGPEEVKKLDAAYLLRKGVYVLFLAGDHPEAADALLKPYF